MILTICENSIQKKSVNKSLPLPTNKRTNWNKFREKLEKFINLQIPIASKKQIDKEVEQLLADMHRQAAEESTPIDDKISSRNNFYSPEIKELVLANRKARRKWQQTRHPSDKTILNRLNYELKSRILELKNESIGDYLSKLTPNKATE